MDQYNKIEDARKGPYKSSTDFWQRYKSKSIMKEKPVEKAE